jgi:hypothetical protein
MQTKSSWIRTMTMMTAVTPMLTVTAMTSSMLTATVAMAALAGCSSSDEDAPDAPPQLRPGVEDSNQVYKGTPSANERAFWVAVRNGDDAALATAVTNLEADLVADPQNGYSQFLVGASTFMPPSAALRALRDGTPLPPRGEPRPTTVLKDALTNLTDPFYLGFAGGLQASIEFAAGNFEEGGPRFALAAQHNRVATAFITVLGDLGMGDLVRAQEDLYAMLEYCNRGPLDRDGRDALRFVEKANAGALAQRECYSGYHAAHASAGELLILADLHALNGNAEAARRYYDAVQSVSDYPTWPLKPLLERRRSGAQPAAADTVDAIAGTCGTCHTNTLP